MAARGARGVDVEHILLDTSYILPTLGVEVEGVKPALEKLRVLRAEGRIVLYYSEFSLLETVARL